METLRAIMSSPWFIVGWALLMLPSLAVLIRDLQVRNAHLMPLMKWVWGLTVVYSGPLGLALYWGTGRKEIAADGPFRRAARSVAHCYSGCGMGEIVGLVLAVGILALGTHWVVVVTFSFAYAAGFALTVGPLVQEGTPWSRALWDAFYSETPSIVVMEIVAIGVDLYLAGDARLGDVLFWSSLIVSLTCGLIAAYPVNYVLIRMGVKEGMMDPRETGHAS
jgi:Mn2+/Fe2+ NRAMP family transporter